MKPNLAGFYPVWQDPPSPSNVAVRLRTTANRSDPPHIVYILALLNRFTASKASWT